MACIDIPAFPALPSLGSLTLTPPALPSLDLSVDLCCRFELILYTPAIPLGAVTLAVPGANTIIAAINTALTAVKAYIDAIPLRCPRSN